MTTRNKSVPEIRIVSHGGKEGLQNVRPSRQQSHALPPLPTVTVSFSMEHATAHRTHRSLRVIEHLLFEDDVRDVQFDDWRFLSSVRVERLMTFLKAMCETLFLKKNEVKRLTKMFIPFVYFYLRYSVHERV